MLSLRKHFGTAGLLVAVVALAAALGGSAVAANGSGSGDATASAKKNRKGGGNLNKLIKREARKFSKVFSQRFSKRFPGPIGPRGFPGLPGAPGEDGDDGDDGDDGSNGANGKSVTVSEVACGGLGGAEVKQEGAAEGVEVCNGEEGSPWTVGGALPSGESLTGAWSIGSETENSAPVGLQGSLDSISFPLKVVGGFDGEAVHYIEASGEERHFDGLTEFFTEPPANCPGDVAAPAADPGHLCVYEAQRQEVELASEFISDPSASSLGTGPGGNGGGETGAVLNGLLLAPPSNEALAWGTWAVTAP